VRGQGVERGHEYDEPLEISRSVASRRDILILIACSTKRDHPRKSSQGQRRVDRRGGSEPSKLIAG